MNASISASPARPNTRVSTDTSRLWSEIIKEARDAMRRDGTMQSYLACSIADHSHLHVALSKRLATKLAEPSLPADALHEMFVQLLADDDVEAAVTYDLQAIVQRDAASSGVMSAFLNYKGFLALSTYRISHQLWRAGRRSAALFLQSRVSEVWSIDIHPAAQIGSSIFIDHGSGIVIGETAVIEDCVSLLHDVTLGGTGKHHGDRHPKVRKGVLIGAGAKILGNVEIGEWARIGAGSVVLTAVPPHCTAVGVPARIIPQPPSMTPAVEMDHSNWVI